jgi:biopolymer transport protein ExbD
MSVQFPCPICNQPLVAAEADRGRKTRCAGCQSIVTIPSAAGPTVVDSLRPNTPPSPAPNLPPRRRKLKQTFAPPPRLRTKPQQDDEIDMTPMIDVVFQLLIFFMVTSAFALQKALPVPTPETSDAVAQQPSMEEPDPSDVLTVRIDADDAMWVEDVQAVSRQDLIAKLRRARIQPGPGGEPPPRKLLVLADPDAHHEAVVTALDAGSAAEMEEVRLATDDDPQ